MASQGSRTGSEERVRQKRARTHTATDNAAATDNAVDHNQFEELEDVGDSPQAVGSVGSPILDPYSTDERRGLVFEYDLCLGNSGAKQKSYLVLGVLCVDSAISLI